LYFTAVLARRSLIAWTASGKQLSVKLGITVDHDIQIEFAPHKLDGTLTHGSCAGRILKKVKDGGSKCARVTRRDNVAIPILRHDITAAWHARGHDWHTSQTGFQQNARDPFAILGGKGKDICDPEDGRNIGSRTGRDHIGCMSLDQRLAHGERSLALPGPNQQKANLRARFVDNLRRIQKGLTVSTTLASPTPS
jgi:hypothetical protein